MTDATTSQNATVARAQEPSFPSSIALRQSIIHVPVRSLRVIINCSSEGPTFGLAFAFAIISARTRVGREQHRNAEVGLCDH